MKIKEVQKKTGLSARTIRYYESRELISPECNEVKGRSCREYSDNDVVQLMAVAALRKSLFSIEEIRHMLEEPEETQRIFEKYKERLRQQRDELDSILRCADSVELSDEPDMFDLASQMNYLAQDLPLPKHDIRPNFGRFDPETPEQRAEAYLRFQRWYKFRWIKKLAPLGIYFLIMGVLTAIIRLKTSADGFGIFLHRNGYLYLVSLVVFIIAMVIRSTSKNYTINFSVMRNNGGVSAHSTQSFNTQVMVKGENDELLTFGTQGSQSGGPISMMKFGNSDKQN